MRSRWLKESITIRKATTNKSMRMTWPGLGVTDDSSVSANFDAKGQDKSYVSLQHGKLRGAGTGEKMKKFWAARLEHLKSTLEA